MGPTLMIRVALREQGVPLNAPNEEVNPSASNLRTEIQSEVRSLREREDEGTVAVQPREVLPEHTLSSDHTTTRDAVHPVTPQGRYR